MRLWYEVFCKCVLFFFPNFSLDVLLGGHDEGKDPDCNIHRDNDGIDPDCATLTEQYGIVSFEAHPQYNQPKHSNDIGLIRLNRDVTLKGIYLRSCP